MKRTILLITAVAICCLAAGSLQGGNAIPQKDGSDKDWATMVASRDRAAREAAIQEVIKNRQQMILSFCEIVHKKNAARYAGESRAAAAYILGEIRASEAVEALSSALGENLFGFRVIKRLPPPYESDDVVLEALVKIGLPSVPEMTRNLCSTDNALIRRQSVRVLNRVLGEEKRVQELVDGLLEKEKDAAVRERLLQAKKIIAASK